MRNLGPGAKLCITPFLKRSVPPVDFSGFSILELPDHDGSNGQDRERFQLPAKEMEQGFQECETTHRLGGGQAWCDLVSQVVGACGSLGVGP